MPKRGTGPAATVVLLFRRLNPVEQEIALDMIRADIKASNGNPTASGAGKRSSRKNATDTSTPNGATATAGATTAGVPICVTCGNEEGYMDHSEPSPGYHKFKSSLRGKKAKEKILLPEDPDTFDPASIQ